MTIMGLAHRETETTTTQFAEAFQAVIAQSAPELSKEPDWVAGLRQKGWSRFQDLGVPTRKNEAWKYINLTPILSTRYATTTAVEAPDRKVDLQKIEPHFLPDPATHRLVFVNGRFSTTLSNLNTLPSGLVVSDLATALSKYSDEIERHLARNIHAEMDALAALNTALFTNGAYVWIPNGLKLAQPVQILFVSTGEAPFATYPRVLVIGETNAAADVLVQYVGPDDSRYLNAPVHEVFSNGGTDIRLGVIQHDSPAGYTLAHTTVYQEAKSRAVVTTGAFTGKTGRHAVHVELLGEEAETVLNGLNVLRGDSEVYHHTVIDHLKPRCQSTQLYKGILDDTAKSEFDGTIHVHVDAQQTDSQQLNKNLLLSDRARVYTRPQLQISADDVKCAHGATVGQLEEEELFYLASRGIPKDLAECLLTYGFAEDVVNRIEQPAIREYLETLLMNRLDQHQIPLLCDIRCRETCEVQV